MAIVVGMMLRRVRIDIHAADRIFHHVRMMMAAMMVLVRAMSMMSVVRLGRCQIAIRVAHEFRPAACRAEVILDIIVVGMMCRLIRFNGHAADRIFRDCGIRDAVAAGTSA
jgi:hypothetical protein